jgi:hypothetical protein
MMRRSNMGKMKAMDIMLQQMQQDVIEDGAIASCALENICDAPTRVAYSFSDVLDLFGSDLEMFGELIVGTPNCEFCWNEDGSDNPASYCWSVPDMRDDPTARERDGVLFTCIRCE